MLMERSTISDGVPFGMPDQTIEMSKPIVPGHLSLDRRQLNRGYPQMGNYLIDSNFHGPYPNWTGRSGHHNELNRLDESQHYYPSQNSNQIMRQNSINADQNHFPFYPRQIQRTSSLRARSQPPPELQESGFYRQIPQRYFNAQSSVYHTPYKTHLQLNNQLAQVIELFCTN